jgi:hemerythrin family non-heme iron protein
MTAKNYSDYTTHKAAHDAFVDKVKGLSVPISADVVAFAKDWLVNHIKGTDFKYKGQL